MTGRRSLAIGSMAAAALAFSAVAGSGEGRGLITALNSVASHFGLQVVPLVDQDGQTAGMDTTLALDRRVPGFTYQWSIAATIPDSPDRSPLARVGTIPDSPDRFHVAANFISNPDLRPAGFGGFDLNIAAVVPDSPDRPAAFLHISDTIPDSPDSWQIDFISNPDLYPSGGITLTLGAASFQILRGQIANVQGLCIRTSGE